jgi:two-component system, response regulator
MKEPEKPTVILLADDDSDDRLLVQDAMADSGWGADLRCVENGEELLDYLMRRGKYQPPASAPWPALILLDLNMPRKSGREALGEIKSHPNLKRIPVVVLTTSKADTDIAGLYDLGANSFISKPVHFEGLVNAMRALHGYWFQMVELPAAT